MSSLLWILKLLWNITWFLTKPLCLYLLFLPYVWLSIENPINYKEWRDEHYPDRRRRSQV